MSRFLVVGAGLAGATLARLLTDDGQDVTIIDRRDKIAGNCRTENKDGIDIHVYGAHIFHTSNENVWHFVNRFADFNRFINSPIAVTKEGEFYNLPFNMNTFSKMFNTRWPSEIEEITSFTSFASSVLERLIIKLVTFSIHSSCNDASIVYSIL